MRVSLHWPDGVVTEEEIEARTLNLQKPFIDLHGYGYWEFRRRELDGEYYYWATRRRRCINETIGHTRDECDFETIDIAYQEPRTR